MPRLFLALRPGREQSAAILQSLHPLPSALGGVPVHESDLHLTLAFLGEVAEDHVQALQQELGRVDPATLHIDLACLDCWMKSRILCLVPDTDAHADELGVLASAIRDAAAAAGAAVDDKPFRAHVTVARKVEPEAAHLVQWPLRLPVPLQFTANGFVLMRSTGNPAGPRYIVERAWRVTAASG